MQQQDTAPVALVTGAGQGIGRAIALRLARGGHAVAVVDLRTETAAAVAAEIAAAGGRAISVGADVTASADRQRMLDTTLAAFGRLDVWVNNAGLMRVALPLDVTEDHWDAVMDVNARAVFFCCQAALRHMVPQRRGCIVNIASIAGKLAGTTAHPVYNASKAAVIAMTRTLALAHAPDGVRVNAVCPGVVATPMQDAVDREFARVLGTTPDAVRAERVGRIPLGRVEQPEDVAGVVAFLAGPDAAYLTGESVSVTGGLLGGW